jgi:hypothetical protein
VIKRGRLRPWLLFALLFTIVFVIIFFLRELTKTSSDHVPPAQSAVRRVGAPSLYPDPSRTPSARNPAVSQSTISETICVPGWTKTVRPSGAETHRIKLEMMRELNSAGSLSEYELDHYLPIELGGCPDCLDNLWLEPYGPGPGAHEKDEVENYLHRRVCDGSMALQEAQRAIVADWYRVYLEIHHVQQSEDR